MNQREDFLFMLEQARRAPSSHNSQPWLFMFNDNEIKILPNYAKALSVVDPDHRELFISLGCVTENICIAAVYKGYDYRITIESDGVIVVNLQRQEKINGQYLFEQMAKQQTNRSQYDGKLLSDVHLQALMQIQLEDQINLHFYHNQQTAFNTLLNLVIEGNTVQMANNAFINELKQWMRFNRKHDQQTNDGLSYAVFGAPNMPMFMAKLIISACLNGKNQNRQDSKKIQSSSHFMLLTTQHNTLIEWINLGRSLQRLLLTCSKLGISYAYMNQPIEDNLLSQKMAEILSLETFPTMLLRLGFADRQPYSKRKPLSELMILN